MGILDSLAGALNSSAGATPTAPASAAPSSAIVSEVLAMLQQHGGVANGLGSLMQAFEGGGLGHLFQSWVGSGQNLPVSASQIQSALGNSGILDKIANVRACNLRMSPSICRHCCPHRPPTPNGQLDPGDAGSALEGLAQRFLHG